MKIQEVIQAINQMLADGVIGCLNDAP